MAVEHRVGARGAARHAHQAEAGAQNSRRFLRVVSGEAAGLVLVQADGSRALEGSAERCDPRRRCPRERLRGGRRLEIGGQDDDLAAQRVGKIRGNETRARSTVDPDLPIHDGERSRVRARRGRRKDLDAPGLERAAERAAREIVADSGDDAGLRTAVRGPDGEVRRRTAPSYADRRAVPGPCDRDIEQELAHRNYARPVHGPRIVAMLHVTNGDVVAAALRASRLDGPVVAWDDPLHEGPVPAALPPAELNAVRAGFIAECGWATYEDALERLDARERVLAGASEHREVVLWFEPDLFDQLQLLQVIDRLRELAESTLVSLVTVDGYLGQLGPDELAALIDGRVALGPGELELALRAWAAFRSAEPTAVESLLGEEPGTLRHLLPALRRQLAELPSVEDGLARTERQILEAVAEGARSWQEAFASSQAREQWMFMGDSAFLLHVERLRRGGALTRGEPLELTELGRRLLARAADFVAEAGIDRWVGGVHLERGSVWRWDPGEGVIAFDRRG